LSSSHSINFTSHRGQNVYSRMYMKKNLNADYEIYVLGKNGEPIKNIEITL